jgi:uncharacterized membrane protein HdeD (DUF308 family)
MVHLKYIQTARTLFGWRPEEFRQSVRQDKGARLIMERTEIHVSAVASGMMLHALAKNWWLILLRGLCAIIFGALAFIWPGITLLTLVLFYGIFALTDGVFAVAAAISGGTPAPRWWLALVGAVGIGVGIATLLWPGMTAMALLLFIAAWAIATGIMQIIGAINLRKEIDDEWFLVASGVLSLLFGCVLALQPGVGALSLILVIGTFAIFFGVLQVSLALRLRRHLQAAR